MTGSANELGDASGDRVRVGETAGRPADTDREWTIRTGTPADRDCIEELWRLFRDGVSQKILDAALDTGHEHHALLRVFVAETTHGGKVVGFGVALRCDPAWISEFVGPEFVADYVAQRNGCLYMLAVHPDYRNQGIGTELVRSRLEWLRGYQVQRVFGVAWERDDHPDSTRLFDRFGFTELARVPDYYQDYWGDEGDARTCPDCGGPCECPARIYARTLCENGGLPDAQ